MNKHTLKNLFLFAACSIVLSSSAFAQKTSLQYVAEGSRYYLDRDYKKAIPPYQKALDLEKKERKLEKNIWIVLVDNLAMAYGISGDIKNSMSVLEYGISK